MLSIFRRDTTSSMTSGPVVPLLATLLVLVTVGLSISGTLYLIRRRRRASQIVLPVHESRHRSLTVTTIPYTSNKRSSCEKKGLLDSPTSPVPEIRITFPEEEGPDGRRKSGRVVIVQVGEAGAAFVRDVPQAEQEESLPKYTVKKNNSTNANANNFDSVDLNQVGGLKEKYQWV